jgi:hypothetical protein
VDVDRDQVFVFHRVSKKFKPQQSGAQALP